MKPLLPNQINCSREPQKGKRGLKNNKQEEMPDLQDDESYT